LAATGLIQGYPDGTFKGDRTMTRYEMAMVVARLLARSESIKIPPPPGAPPQPEVTKEDLDLILQLVNELRAELTDKNVRWRPWRTCSMSSMQEYEAGVIYTFSKYATVRVLYRDLTMGGVDQQSTYRAQLDFSF
jgi:hypothetical protein